MRVLIDIFYVDRVGWDGWEECTSDEEGGEEEEEEEEGTSQRVKEILLRYSS